MANTFIVKGAVITNPSYDNVNNAHFVRVVATGQTTVTVDDNDSSIVGTVYLHAAGDEVILEKQIQQRISCAAAKVSAVAPKS
jgi:hypothetical protein|tara:strand:- start:3947 stop:4195 length:249 start_codon:yes stop_codon:yes gene_type:complete